MDVIEIHVGKDLIDPGIKVPVAGVTLRSETGRWNEVPDKAI
jgi:hypothetical protein